MILGSTLYTTEVRVMARVFWHCLDDDKVTMAMAVIATVVVELID